MQHVTDSEGIKPGYDFALFPIEPHTDLRPIANTVELKLTIKFCSPAAAGGCAPHLLLCLPLCHSSSFGARRRSGQIFISAVDEAAAALCNNNGNGMDTHPIGIYIN